MSVNPCARQFEDPGLAEDVAQVLRGTGLDPGDLTLEITKSVSMKHARSAAGTLEELNALGVGIAIDDFGTGYSSLSYLKIDRSFIGGLGEDRDERELLPGMVGLAHALGPKVVAEGVETAEKFLRLREVGCDLAQGYYFSRPLPGEAASALLPSDTPRR